jgi:hypothetical protein
MRFCQALFLALLAAIGCQKPATTTASHVDPSTKFDKNTIRDIEAIAARFASDTLHLSKTDYDLDYINVDDEFRIEVDIVEKQVEGQFKVGGGGKLFINARKKELLKALLYQ